MEPQAWALAAKPFLYWGVFSLARVWSDHPERVSRWRPVLGGLLRPVAGILIGIPVALAFAGLGETWLAAAFSLFRFLLWLLFLAILIPGLRPSRRALVAFAATGLNWAIDLLIFGSLWTDFHFIRC